MMPDCETIWGRCLHVIESNITATCYKTWFLPIKPLSLDNDTLTLQVPTPFFVEYLEENYINLISSALRKEIGPNARLNYQALVVETPPSQVSYTKQVKPAVSTGNNMSGGFVSSNNDVMNNPFSGVGVKTMNIDPQLNAEYTFGNFIEGECNKFACSVANAVAKSPGKTAFNPLFIYGNSGLGKTHLAQAVGADVKARMPEKNVVYLCANRFMRQYMDASKNNAVNGFLNFYQMIDVLIIDDIQELAGKTGTESVFFHIFNHLQQNNKQIIITADKAPVEISGMEDRLLSRFKWGVIAEMQSPDYETRIKILENKIKNDGLELPNDIICFIASNVSSNIRELEGSLASLLAQATLMKCDITMETAKRVVGSLVKRSEKPELSVDTISEAVCKAFGVDVVSLRSKSRRRELVQARQVAMFLSKNLTNTSLSTIGAKIGNRDHSTVLHSCKAVVDMLETNSDFKERVRILETQLRG